MQRLDHLLLDYESTVSEAMNAGVDVVSQDFTISWNYLQSVFFSTTILTTIGWKIKVEKVKIIPWLSGYGNIAPVTFPGRLFCLLFGIIGIPFTLSVIADVGGLFATLLSKFWEKHKDKFKAIHEKLRKKRNK